MEYTNTENASFLAVGNRSMETGRAILTRSWQKNIICWSSTLHVVHQKKTASATVRKPS